MPSRPGMMRQTNLERIRKTQIYRDRMISARLHLDQWLCQHGVILDLNKDSAEIIDDTLAAYIDASRSSGTPIHVPKHALLHVQWVRRALRFHLPRSWENVGSWEEQVGAVPRTPMPFDFLMGMFLSGLNALPNVPLGTADLISERSLFSESASTDFYAPSKCVR